MPRGRPFPPGVSGNPQGRPPELNAIRDLARTYTEEAIETLVRIMRKGRTETVRLAAACALLDRAYGKPAVAIEHSGPDGQTLFPSPAELRQLSDGQLERLRTFLQEFSAEVEGNGGAPR
jgi:3-methyladenine DNA glycosylase/8-oxoguanine DNA glycosylase